MKKLKVFLFTCLVTIIFGSCTTTQEEKNKIISSNKDVTEFEYKGHQYIRFSWGRGRYASAGVVHNPDCPCFKYDQ